MGSPIKPGDLVRTPLGRTARVRELRADGKRELAYIDAEGGEVVLGERDLTLVVASEPRPWKERYR